MAGCCHMVTCLNGHPHSSPSCVWLYIGGISLGWNYSFWWAMHDVFIHCWWIWHSVCPNIYAPISALSRDWPVIWHNSTLVGNHWIFWSLHNMSSASVVHMNTLISEQVVSSTKVGWHYILMMNIVMFQCKVLLSWHKNQEPMVSYLELPVPVVISLEIIGCSMWPLTLWS